MKIKLDACAFEPIRAHSDDAGLDLRTPIDILLHSGQSIVIDTGIHVEIPKGFVGMLKSKSGLNVKHGIVSEGVIDHGYTGSIIAKLYNLSKEAHFFEAGDKITQLVIMPIITPEIEIVDTVNDFYGGQSERADGGFGSSGR